MFLNFNINSLEINKRIVDPEKVQYIFTRTKESLMNVSKAVKLKDFITFLA